MNTDCPDHDTVSPPVAESALADQRHRLKAHIEHLFRYSLQRSQINPLMHLVWRYRSAALQRDSDALG